MIKSIINSLDKNLKKKIFLFIIFSVGMTLIESATVASMVPVVQIIIDNIKINFLQNLNLLYELEYSKRVLIALIFLISIFLIKNLALSFFTIWQFNFFKQFELNLSSKLFSKYINQNYSFYLKNNSGVLSNNVMYEVGGVKSYLKSACTLFSESILFVTILVLLLYLEPTATIFLFFILTSLSILAYFFIAKKIKSWGKKRFEYQGISNKNIIESLEGIKIIKFFSSELNIIKRFYSNISRTLEFRKKYELINEFPRIFYETIGILCFCLLVFFLLYLNRVEDLIVTASLFLTATLRILPSITRISRSYQTLLSSNASVKKVYEHLQLEVDKKIHTKEKLQFDKKIEIKNISFKFENNHEKILKNIDIKISKGEKIGIIGPSGCGKSTLLDLLTGIIKTNHGSISIDDRLLNETTIQKWLNNIGVVGQNTFLLDDTIANNIKFFSEEENIQLKECLEIVDFYDHVKNLESGFETITGERGTKFSGGQRQRIAIARSIFRNPEVFIFDEATSAIDEKSEKIIFNNLFERFSKNTFIVVAHKFSMLKNFDRIFIMDQGQIIKEGNYNEIF